MFSLVRCNEKAVVFGYDGKGETKSWYEDEDVIVIATSPLEAFKYFFDKFEFNTLSVNYKIFEGDDSDARDRLNKLLIKTDSKLEVFTCENPNEEDLKYIKKSPAYTPTDDIFAQYDSKSAKEVYEESIGQSESFKRFLWGVLTSEYLLHMNKFVFD